MTIYADNSQTFGLTPIVRLTRIKDGAKATVLAKIEGRNPAYSVKGRIGLAMIHSAQQQGILVPGKELLEATSGNTGIAVAMVAAAKGIPLTLTIPENMSVERHKLLRALGARLIFTDDSKGMAGAIEKAAEIAVSFPGRYVYLSQFDNPANAAIHEATTGPEIWKDTGGNVDILVAGVGTGGTITGVSRYFKLTKNRQIISVAVEPAASPVISQIRSGQEIKPGAHQIQGIGAGFIPNALDLSLIDEVEQVIYEDAIEYAHRLAKDEGILAGFSSGAAVSVAVRLAHKPENQGKNIVVILPDTAERYLSTSLFNGLT